MEAADEGAAVEASADEQPERFPLLDARDEVRPCLAQLTRRPNASFSESVNLLPGEARGALGTGAKPGFNDGIGGNSGIEHCSWLGACTGRLGGSGLPEPNLGGGGGLQEFLTGAGLPASRSDSLTGTGLFFVDNMGLFEKADDDGGLSAGNGESFTGVGLLILGRGLPC